mmetsp:Transcript_10362/g.23380  ORF Transcript_10362/g.23380 Transcript_10362/m.23380 type:complete len:243 (+) Transcript_10362:1675-2403(+)
MTCISSVSCHSSTKRCSTCAAAHWRARALPSNSREASGTMSAMSSKPFCERKLLNLFTAMPSEGCAWMTSDHRSGFCLRRRRMRSRAARGLRGLLSAPLRDGQAWGCPVASSSSPASSSSTSSCMRPRRALSSPPYSARHRLPASRRSSSDATRAARLPVSLSNRRASACIVPTHGPELLLPEFPLLRCRTRMRSSCAARAVKVTTATRSAEQTPSERQRATRATRNAVLPLPGPARTRRGT